jgi:hypothetical protein
VPPGSGADAAGGEAGDGGAKMDEDQRAADAMLRERQLLLQAQQAARAAGRGKRGRAR